MANYREDIVNIDLECGNIFRSWMKHTIGEGDALADRFGVRVFRNGVPVQLSGTCTGYFIRADGETVPVENGVIDGNLAYVKLINTCYAIEGVFSLAIKINDGAGEIVTLRIVDGIVSRTSSNIAVDPGTIIPSIEDLIALINEATATIPLDYSSLVTAVRRAFDYNDSMLRHRYEKQIVDCIGKIRRAVILPNSDDYDTPSARAVYYLVNSEIGQQVVVYAGNNKQIGIIKRSASDYSYIGYEVDLTNKRSISFIPESGYIYGVLYSNGTTNFTDSEIEQLNLTTYIYTGKSLSDNDIIPIVHESSMVSDSDILIGKYYAGAAAINNPEMAYTAPFAVIENRHYYAPYMTFGYTWFDEGGNPLGGGYTNTENFVTPIPYFDIVSPPGAVSVGISCRAGDANLLKAFSEIANSSAFTDKAGSNPVLQSAVKGEGLNWIYNIRFDQNRAPSRVYMTRSDESDSWTFIGECAVAEVGNGSCNIGSYDLVTMDNSKIAVVVSVPSGSAPRFVFGYNPFYNGLDISDGGLAVVISSDGETAEIRSGNGENGNYNTLLKTVDISSLNLHGGGRFYISLEKDSVNKQTFTIYNALCPDAVIVDSIEAEPASGDDNTYTGQVRCWGAAYLRVISGELNVYALQMYSTAPTYPRIAIWGDSYIENYGRNPNCGFGHLLKTALDGSVFTSGRGGSTAQQGLYRFNTEINTCAPQFVIVCFGVNDSFNTTVEAYKTAIQQYINSIKEKGARPILVTVPRINTGTLDNLTWIQSVNPWIRASGYDYIDLAFVLSNGDGETPDYNKYMPDKTHPNLIGGQAIFNYIKAFLPFLLWT